MRRGIGASITDDADQLLLAMKAAGKWLAIAKELKRTEAWIITRTPN